MNSTLNTSNCYPLSSSQLNIWALEQAFPGTSINNICETIRIRGTFDVALLQSCLNRIVEADSTLRTRITLNSDSVPVQYEIPHTAHSFPVFDFSTTNHAGIERWEESVTREVMPVLDAPLFYFAIIKIGEHEGGVLVKTHHLISDGWSQVSLINRIAKTYLSLLGGEKAVLDPTPSYRHHVEEERRYHASPAFDRDRAFWEETLRDVPHPASLKECSSAEISPVGQRKTFWLSETLNHALSSFCTAHRVAPFAVFYMAVSIYLKRVQGLPRLCLGAPVHNRSSITGRQTTGMFVSTLPFFSELNEEWSFEEFNQQLADHWLDLLRHQKFPFSAIMELARKQNPEADRLFHLVLSFHSGQAYRSRDTSIAFSGQWHYAGYQAEHLCIHLNNLEDERRYSVNYDYLAQLFSEREIEAFHHYLTNILMQTLTSPEKPIRDLSLLNPDEEERVLYTFNRTEAFYYSGTLWQKFSDVCREYASRVVVIQSGERYTYEQLRGKANAIAREIVRLVPQTETTAAVLLPKSFSLYAAIVGIAQAGCAWVLLSPEMPEQRIREILSDSGAAVLLGTGELLQHFSDSGCPVIDVGALAGPEPEEQARSSDPEDLAYLVYTSGSTGKPKGVEIEQQSLLNFAEAMRPIYGGGAVLSLCNVNFDAFLLESAVSMLNGCTIVLPEEGEEEDPARLAALIRSYAVGFLAVTPSRLSAYLKQPDFRHAAARLESIVCGGEAFPAGLLKTLSRCTSARIYNQYGPSEATIGVCSRLLNDAASLTVGAPMQNCRCYVLDKQRKPLPVGVYGDLFLGGVCVGRGYRNAPDRTAEAFSENPFEPGERLYRTGDIAAWTPDGELLIKGRADSQIKLRGQRIELEEISARLSLHPSIRQSAVRLLSMGGQDVLVAYYAAEGVLSDAELLEFCATYLPGYMIPSVFLPVPALPLTPNGKVDYSRLPLPQTAPSAAAPTSELQERILRIFRRVLQRPELSAESDYFLSGGDSLNALETLSALEEEFGVRLRVADLYACRTARRLEARLGGGQSLVPDICTEELRKAPALDSYPLTAAQLGIYFETQMAPHATAYNMPCGFRIPTAPDSNRLAAALQALSERVPVLRTTFLSVKGEIRQKSLPSVFIPLEYPEGDTLEKASAAFVRPFDLSKPPLFRAALWQDQDGSAVVMIDMHHIIGDAVTAAMLLRQLDALYRGEPLQELSLAYTDYAVWQAETAARRKEQDRPFWKEALQDSPELPELPTDFPRPKRFDFRGSTCLHLLSTADSARCDAYCEQHAITPYVLFAGAFGILLSKLTGSSDFFVGTPISGRRNPAVSGIAGLLISTLPLRLSPRETLSLSSYLHEVQSRLVGILDHPDVPLEELIALSGLKRSADGNPFYHTIVSMRPVDTDSFTFDGRPAEPIAVPSGSAKVDLNLEVAKASGCYLLRLEYATSLFDRETAAFYTRCLNAIVQAVLRDDGCTVEACSAMAPSDHFRLIERPLSCSAAYADLPIDRQVDAAAEIAPEAPALIFHDEILTLGELKRKSDALAGRLQREGVRPGDAIGLLCRRGPELPIAMMAVLKLGCAYVPMLPSFPENRLKYMMEISGVSLTLCDAKTLETRPKELPGRFLKIHTEDGDAPYQPPEGRDNSREVCFILFTSGSTGQPKGVMIRHRSISNLIAVLSEPLSAVDGAFLCTANSIFDIFITETLIAMSLGKCVVMADEEEMMLPWKTAALMVKHHVKWMEFTPSRAQLFLNNDAFFAAAGNISLAMICGEVFSPQLLQKVREAGCRRIFNLYGPTEVTVYATMDDVTHAERITVGTMYPNCRGYILDENLRPVLPTARGELYFSGECLAAGYAGREDLTREAFLPDPFFPGQRMYRSGDIVRLLPDGRIDFVGRRDHQVKLNGQRIELAEITKKILDSNMVSQAASVVCKDGNFMVLRAFLEPRAGETVDIGALRRYLSAELPSYMVPSDLIVLSSLPKTASGKLDLKALEAIKPDRTVAEPSHSVPPAAPASTPAPVPPVKQPEPAVAAEPLLPENPVPALEALWKETLSLNTVDTERPFFEQGGTSLAALSLLSDYYNRGWAMTLAEFYDHPTLSEQAAFLSKGRDGLLPKEEEEMPLPPVSEDSAQEADTALPSAAPASLPAEPSHPVLPAAPVLAPVPPVKQPEPAVSAEPLLPENPVPVLEALWEETLSLNTVDTERSFFEQGGTSLAALSLLSDYYNRGWAMTLAEFYDHPTLSEQAAVLSGTAAPSFSAPGTPVSSVSLSEKPEPAEQDAVLLTGATGFLGAHLLKVLFDTGYRCVYCPIRGGDSSRLEETLSWYFGSAWLSSVRSGIHCLPGDITEEHLGLSDGDWETVCARTGLIFHTAADVRHYASDDTPERTNRIGTAHVLALAKRARARFVHISTISLCGEYLTASPEVKRNFSEEDFEIGQNWQESVYLRGKFESERLVRQAAAEGLSAVILRIGRLVGRSTDGIFQKNAESNAFWVLIRSLQRLQKIDRAAADAPVEMTAVNECAEAIVSLANGPALVYHVFNPYTVTVREILSALHFPLEEVSRECFQNHLGERLRAGDALQLAPLVDQYNRFCKIPSNLSPVCSKTETELAARRFFWEKPDPAMLLRAFPHGSAEG